MTTVSIRLPQVTAEKLRERASRLGKSLETYLQDLAQENAAVPAVNVDGAPSLAELDRVLDELAADLPTLPRLPDGFSRADIYAEHD
jgi:non-ribosomal peptide synthetase component E (peptide arylation enzyme)